MKLRWSKSSRLLQHILFLVSFAEMFSSYTIQKAMYKTRNTGTGKEMRRTWGMEECCIPGNVAKHSGEHHQIFRGISSNIPGNVTKHSGQCHQIFRGMLPNIPGNVIKNSGERHQTFQEMLPIFGEKGMVAFRILLNIHDGALLQKWPTALIR